LHKKPCETEGDRNGRKHANEDACGHSCLADAKSPKHLRLNRNART
jgi:hypothetical protein